VNTFAGAPPADAADEASHNHRVRPEGCGWFALRFLEGESDEALAADGWRWRAFSLLAFTACVFVASLVPTVAATIRNNGDARSSFFTGGPVFWMIGFITIGVILAIDHRFAGCLRRMTVATVLHAVVHLLLVLIIGGNLFADATWTANNHHEGGGWNVTLSPYVSPQTQFFRQDMALLNLYTHPILIASFMPTSLAGRWIGLVLQATVRLPHPSSVVPQPCLTLCAKPMLCVTSHALS
jgi:hypothetical protein